MQIALLGDSALIVRIRDDFENDPDEASDAVLAALHRLESANIPGVIELAPAYTTVAVFFDPMRAIEAGAPASEVFLWFEAKIQEILAAPLSKKVRIRTSRLVEIPVCYDREFGLDLEEVARRSNLTTDEATTLHASAEYRVCCLGFTPGFPFMSGLDARLATPRRATPRSEVPAGSVAIGGSQTGVYPLRSPGGWNVIGRTPLRMFDVKRDPPALLSAGDRVRFRPITSQEFETVKKEITGQD